MSALLRQAISGQGQVLACFMTRMEVLYRVWKDEDERRARLADAQLQALPPARKGRCWCKRIQNSR